MIDFHSHVLFDIDDGSHNIEESIQMLRMSYEQGVDTMVLSSHFRSGETNIKKFLADRRDRFDRIVDAMTEDDKLHCPPNLVLGAEVEFKANMNKWDYLDKLCINGTKYIMTEMPFIPWTKSVVQTIADIADNTDMTPIIPHIDRYFHTFTPMKYIEKLYTMPVMIQMNGIYFNNYNNVQYFKEIVDNGTIHILGSDCHGPEWRTPNLGPAVKMIEEVCEPGVLDRIEATGRKILEGAIFEQYR